MDNSEYVGDSIQWIQQTVKSAADETTTTTSQLLIDSQSSQPDDLIVNNSSTCSFLGVGNDADITNLDQIAAENLIFMARDGKMTEIITTADTNENEVLVVAASDGTQINCDGILQQAALIQNEESNDDGIYADHVQVDHYTDNTPQMVTEEIITDDWVQHQGEERVEIPAEQIIGSGSHILLDMEVPLSTVQDEYSVLRPYPCDFCSRRFRKKTSLMNHMVAHQSDRPHLCKLCNSRFLRRQDLINHLKAHAEEELPMDDNDYIHFDGGGSPGQRQSNDQFYEQSWSVPSESLLVKSNHKYNISDINPATATSLIRVSPPSGSRGRISRLKLKEGISYLENSHNSDIGQLSYENDQVITPLESALYLQDDSKANVQMELHRKGLAVERNKPFVCQQCGLAFAREKAFLSHTKTHRQDSPYECNQCNELFWDNDSLQEHQKTHLFEDSNSEYDPNEGEKDDDDETQTESEAGQKLYGDFFCSMCGISFHRFDLLKKHAKSHKGAENDAVEHKNKASNSNCDSNKEYHCCNTCGETFAEALDLLAHAEVHARYPPFKCVLCGETFIEESTIKRHLQVQHSNEMTENSCILCGKGCRDRKALIKHAWDHSREKCHSCSKCGKNFHNKARLKRHMTSHRDKSVQCEVCREAFPDGRTLSNHRHSHSTNSGKLFPCHECGKTFGSRSSQQIHVRIHTGERPYGCRYCWKAFADGGTLRKHERIHTGEKPYGCSVCPRAFNQRVVLREHIRSHHSGLDNKRGTYFCTVCSAEMSSSRDLIQHLIEHSDKNTAKQRQPVAGPRKYKRRRKLKPHELARLKREGKCFEIENFSDFDLSDIDDLLCLNDSSTATNDNEQSIKKQINSKKTNNNSNNNNHFKHKSQQSHLEMDADAVNWEDNNKKSSTTTRTHNIGESLLKKTILPSANDLVMDVTASTEQQNSTTVKIRNSLRRKSKQNPNVTEKVQPTETLGKGRKMKTIKSVTNRPQMIHTEKRKATVTTAGNSDEGNKGKKKKRNISTRTTIRSNIASLPKTSTILDDYDIISPQSQPPKQISSSPLRVKQEHKQQQQTYERKSGSRMNSSRLIQSATNDLYDAHLLLEASGLRHDLDDMLHSPLKAEKNGGRQRFISESSSQFMTERPEEEQHLIKIEPTSPDLREIVNCVSTTTNEVELEPSSIRTSTRSSVRTTQHIRCGNAKVGQQTMHTSKFLTFPTNIANSNDINTKSSTANSNHLNATISKSLKTINNSIIASSNASSSSFLDYGYGPTDVTSSTSSGNSSFSSINAVVSAADANAAAVAQQNPANVRRPRRYFECEMCSAVFSDRAQLLDHVPIHI